MTLENIMLTIIASWKLYRMTRMMALGKRRRLIFISSKEFREVFIELSIQEPWRSEVNEKYRKDCSAWTKQVRKVQDGKNDGAGKGKKCIKPDMGKASKRRSTMRENKSFQRYLSLEYQEEKEEYTWLGQDWGQP